MYASQMQGGGKYFNAVGIPICHFMQRQIYIVMIGGLPLGSTLKRRGLGSDHDSFACSTLKRRGLGSDT